jgi:hypothetical protein
MAHDKSRWVAVGADHDVYVVRQNRTRENLVARFLYGNGKALTNGAGLNAGENHRRVFQVVLRFCAEGTVVPSRGDGTRGVDLGSGAAATKEFSGGDPCRPGASRVIREPETEGTEDGVEAAHGQNR